VYDLDGMPFGDGEYLDVRATGVDDLLTDLL
jgi:hypothetical protein